MTLVYSFLVCQIMFVDTDTLDKCKTRIDEFWQHQGVITSDKGGGKCVCPRSFVCMSYLI